MDGYFDCGVDIKVLIIWSYDSLSNHPIIFGW